MLAATVFLSLEFLAFAVCVRCCSLGWIIGFLPLSSRCVFFLDLKPEIVISLFKIEASKKRKGIFGG